MSSPAELPETPCARARATQLSSVLLTEALAGKRSRQAPSGDNRSTLILAPEAIQGFTL